MNMIGVGVYSIWVWLEQTSTVPEYDWSRWLQYLTMIGIDAYSTWIWLEQTSTVPEYDWSRRLQCLSMFGIDLQYLSMLGVGVYSTCVSRLGCGSTRTWPQNPAGGRPASGRRRCMHSPIDIQSIVTHTILTKHKLDITFIKLNALNYNPRLKLYVYINWSKRRISIASGTGVICSRAPCQAAQKQDLTGTNPGHNNFFPPRQHNYLMQSGDAAVKWLNSLAQPLISGHNSRRGEYISIITRILQH